MKNQKPKTIDMTPSWNFVAGIILATLDCNTNIKSKDRTNIKTLLMDMAKAGDNAVKLSKEVDVLSERWESFKKELSNV